MKYHLLTDASLLDLQNKVNAFIRDGWTPQGGVSVTGRADPYKWSQAMVKHED